MQRSLQATGHAAAFDFFILSDTTNAEIAAEEERLYGELRERLAGETRLFYRRRAKNTGKKAGNIAEWIATRGRRLRLHDRARRRQPFGRRHHGAAGRPDGGQSAHRPDPDPHRAGRPRDAVRPRPAVLVAHDRRRAVDGQQLLADQRSQLLRPQRHPARRGLRRLLPPAGALGPAAARRRDPEPRFRRGGLPAARRLVLLAPARAARQLRGAAQQPARLRGARPPLDAGQPAACPADRRRAACTG